MTSMHTHTLVAALALSLVACKFTPSAGAGGGPDAGSTPTGDAGSGATGDAGPPDAPVAPSTHCAAPAAIHDAFDDGVTDAMWRALGPTYANYETGGHLVLAPTDATAVGYRSKSYVDLTGSAAEVEVTQMFATQSDGVASFALVVDATHYLAIGEAGGMLSAQIVDGGAPAMHDLPYDPAQHWWRIAEAGGTVAFQTSADHASWTTVYQAATPAFASAVALELAATAPSGDSVGTASFDELDTQLPAATWCKADSLHDQFARTTLGPAWLRTGARGTGCSTWVGSGAHVDQFGEPSQCWFESSQAFDLTNSSIEVTRVATGAAPSDWTVYLAAVAPTGEYAELYANNGELCAVTDTTTIACQADDPSQTRLRLREASGSLMFELGDPTSGAWITLATIDDPFALDAISGEFGTATDVDMTGEPTPGSFTAYNEL